MTVDSSLARPRILLIGATGQVGRALVDVLPRLGEVVATSRQATSNTAHIEYRELDLTDLSAVRRVVREVRPTTIVNAAAYTAVDRAETEHELAMTLNGTVPGVLGEEARRIGAAVIHYSTDYVFAGTGTRPWSEQDQPAPLSVYGRTKLAGESALRDSGAAHLTFRIAWIYAPQGQNFVNTMLRLGAERAELRVVDDQIGAPTPASAVAQATAAILAQAGRSPDFFPENGGILHLPCQGETSWHGFATEIFRLARDAGLPMKVERVLPIPTSDYPTPAKRPANSRLDGALAHARFNVELPEWRAALVAEFPAIAQEFADRAG